MRVTDDRYAGELEKFDLAMRMIRHEARTGTIRACTGFTEDRVRKLVASYCRQSGHVPLRRRRGKSPRQVTPFVSSAERQAEATLLATLYIYCRAARVTAEGRIARIEEHSPVQMGERVCQAYELYLELQNAPALSFEWAWNLYHALLVSGELYFSWCRTCDAPYVQDRYALDYEHCPSCELRDQQERRPVQPSLPV
jgi:hypothetical protein